MIRRNVVRLACLALPLAFASVAHADATSAKACGAKLPKEAQVIFNQTLPQIAPGADVKGVLTNTTRSLAMNGTINRGTARASAQAAYKCLTLAAQ